MLCPSCVNHINEGAKFCTNCGMSLYSDNNSNYPIKMNTQYNSSNIIKRDEKNYEVTKNRSFIKYYLLSLVTFGIYGIVFMHRFIKDLNFVCDDGDDSPNIFLLILLSIVTCGIYNYYWIYKQSDRIKNAGLRLGVVIIDDGKSVLSICILIAVITFGSLGTFLGYYFLMRNFNVLAEKF